MAQGEKNSLQAVLDKSSKVKSTTLENKDSEKSTETKYFRPSREGRKLISGHFDPGIAKKLKFLAVEEDKTVQSLLEEAIHLLFIKKGMAK